MGPGMGPVLLRSLAAVFLQIFFIRLACPLYCNLYLAFACNCLNTDELLENKINEMIDTKMNVSENGRQRKWQSTKITNVNVNVNNSKMKIYDRT